MKRPQPLLRWDWRAGDRVTGDGVRSVLLSFKTAVVIVQVSCQMMLCIQTQQCLFFFRRIWDFHNRYQATAVVILAILMTERIIVGAYSSTIGGLVLVTRRNANFRVICEHNITL